MTKPKSAEKPRRLQLPPAVNGLNQTAQLVYHRLLAIETAKPYLQLAMELRGLGLTDKKLTELLQRPAFGPLSYPCRIALMNAMRDLELENPT